MRVTQKKLFEEGWVIEVRSTCHSLDWSLSVLNNPLPFLKEKNALQEVESYLRTFDMQYQRDLYRVTNICK